MEQLELCLDQTSFFQSIMQVDQKLINQCMWKIKLANFDKKPYKMAVDTYLDSFKDLTARIKSTLNDQDYKKKGELLSFQYKVNLNVNQWKDALETLQ